MCIRDRFDDSRLKIITCYKNILIQAALVERKRVDDSIKKNEFDIWVLIKNKIAKTTDLQFIFRRFDCELQPSSVSLKQWNWICERCVCESVRWAPGLVRRAIEGVPWGIHHIDVSLRCWRGGAEASTFRSGRSCCINRDSSIYKPCFESWLARTFGLRNPRGGADNFADVCKPESASACGVPRCV